MKKNQNKQSKKYNKRFERIAVNQLKNVFQDLQMYELKPVSEIEQPPDIIAHKKGYESIGIEVTRVYSDNDQKSGSSSRANLSICQNIIMKCNQLHRKKTKEWFYVNVHFSDLPLLDNLEFTERVSNQLVNYLVYTDIEVAKRTEFRAEDLWKDDRWPQEVLYMSVYRLPIKGKAEWHFSWSVWINTTSQIILQRAIDKKEKLFCKKAFCEKTDFKWLLLVCDPSAPTGNLEFHDSINNEIYTSSFDKVFVLDHRGMVTELLLSKPTSLIP